MTRVKGGTSKLAHRKKILKQAKGYFGSKHRLYRTAKEQVMHSGMYAYRDRRQKKRDFRKLWITRINAACRLNEVSYSRFMEGLTKAKIKINRKMLSEIAINDPKAFSDLVQMSKNNLTSEVNKDSFKIEDDLLNLTVTELKKIAKEKSLVGYSKMKKDDLIKALNN